MSKTYTVAIAVLVLVSASQAIAQTPMPSREQESPAAPPPPVAPSEALARVASGDDGAPLSQVASQVQAALDQYHRSRGQGKDALPPLASAELNFKVTTVRTVGGSINLYIIKLGASAEDTLVNDVTLTYTAPTAIAAAPAAVKPSLTDELVKTIQAAAAAAKRSPAIGAAKFNKCTITVQYGVKWDGNAGVANVPIYFVTVGLNGGKNKNSIQSIKLSFGKDTK